VAIGVLGALAFAAAAQACSCVHLPPGEAMRSADAAISGRLLRVIPRGRLQADYRYRVQRVYKYAPGIRRGRTISVRSATQSAACGLPSRTGRRYGLLLAWGEGRWAGGLCGLFRPRELDAAYAGTSCAS
jgi:hypothetical protein